MKYRLLTFALAMASLNAHAGLFSDDEARKQAAQTQEQVKALDGRVGKLEASLNGRGMLELLSDIDQLKRDAAKLRGDVETINHRLDEYEQRQKDLYLDLDTRMRRLEGVGGAGSAPSTSVPAAPGGAPSPVPPSLPGAAPASSQPAMAEAPAVGNEQHDYEAAFNLFKSGDYRGAMAAFRGFISAYPQSPRAASAQYWIGNSFFNLRDFNNAIAAQQDLLARYPNSQKAPDGMLNMASSYQALGDRASARRVLEEIVAKFPSSPAADVARKRLQEL